MTEEPILPYEPDDRVLREFVRFHTAHPEVYTLFIRFCREAKAAGRTHFSAEAVIQRIRWESVVNPEHDFEGFKINNNFSAMYSRKIMSEMPQEFGGFFQLRKRKSVA